MDRLCNEMDKLRVKRNLFKTTTQLDGFIKVEPVSPKKFYGKTISPLRIYSEQMGSAHKSPKAEPKDHDKPAVRIPSRPNDEARKSKKTGRPRYTGDELPEGFVAEFVAAVCGKK